MTMTMNYVRNYNVYEKIFYTKVLWYFLLCIIVCLLLKKIKFFNLHYPGIR